MFSNAEVEKNQERFRTEEPPAETLMTERGGKAQTKDTLISKDNKESPDSPTDEKKGGKTLKPERISFFKLFKYSGCCQKAMMITGLLAAMVAGAAAPSIAIVFGEIVAIFDPENTPDEMMEGITKLFKLIAILCAVLWVFGYLQYACLQSVAERLSFDLRTLYLK